MHHPPVHLRSGRDRLASAEDTTRAVQAMRKAQRLGLLDGAIVGIGNAPTALIEVVRLIREEGRAPGAGVGMPVGFVSAAESKALLMTLTDVPWVAIAAARAARPWSSPHPRPARPGRSGAAEAPLERIGQALAPAKVRKGDAKRDRGNRTRLHHRRLLGRGRGARPRSGWSPARCRTAWSAVLPNGQRVRFAVSDGASNRGRQRAHAVVVKDAGDDPDATMAPT
jgi:hypothetical protein